MAWYWWAATAIGGAGVMLAMKSLRAMSAEFQHERARELFRLQRERLEAKFLDAAAATGKPKGLTWVDVAFENHLELVREAQTRELLGLVPVTIKFAAVEGGPMEGVEAVGNLRYATAVFSFQKGQWITQGRALFNMHPHEALEHFGGSLQRVI
jgi:hypothetical protein